MMRLMSWHGGVRICARIFIIGRGRKKGIAKALLAVCESWAKEKGCTEFASDCELDNAGSIAFHLGAGFTEANRIVCFTKRLGEEA